MPGADFETLAELAPAGVGVYTNRFLFVNSAMENLTGYSRDELLAMHPRDLVTGGAEDRLTLRAKDGGLRRVRVRERQLDDGPMLLNWTEITHEPCMHHSPRVLETTGEEPLPRTAMELRLAEELVRADRYGTAFSLVMLLLDDGAAADAEPVVRSLRRSIRACDQIGCWRRGQFVVTAPALPLTEAAGFAVKLRQLVESHAPDAHLTASLGVAQYLPGEGLNNLLARAAQAMHAAHRHGGNRVETG